MLDRIHQSMILFAAGRSEALKRFLVEDGVGRDARYWRLAQAFPLFILPAPTRNAGSMAYWRGRRDWDFDKATELEKKMGEKKMNSISSPDLHFPIFFSNTFHP